MVRTPTEQQEQSLRTFRTDQLEPEHCCKSQDRHTEEKDVCMVLMCMREKLTSKFTEKTHGYQHTSMDSEASGLLYSMTLR